jgi:prepilin-type N-terminal cleavage/methylation domain-containing protein
MLKMRARKGFSLTELVVVLAVIALIAAIAVPTFSAVRSNAAQRAAEASAELMAKNALALAIQNDDGDGRVSAQEFEDALFAAVGESSGMTVISSDGIEMVVEHPNGMRATITFDEGDQSYTVGGSSDGSSGGGGGFNPQAHGGDITGVVSAVPTLSDGTPAQYTVGLNEELEEMLQAIVDDGGVIEGNCFAGFMFEFEADVSGPSVGPTLTMVHQPSVSVPFIAAGTEMGGCQIFLWAVPDGEGGFTQYNNVTFPVTFDSHASGISPTNTWVLATVSDDVDVTLSVNPAAVLPSGVNLALSLQDVTEMFCDDLMMEDSFSIIDDGEGLRMASGEIPSGTFLCVMYNTDGMLLRNDGTFSDGWPVAPILRAVITN